MQPSMCPLILSVNVLVIQNSENFLQVAPGTAAAAVAGHTPLNADMIVSSH